MITNICGFYRKTLFSFIWFIVARFSKTKIKYFLGEDGYIPPHPHPWCTWTINVAFEGKLFNMHKMRMDKVITGSLLTKIVDPSLESSLKILIFVPTRSFGMPCCPPPFAKAGTLITPGFVPSDCLTQSGRAICYVWFVYLWKTSIRMSSLVHLGGII